MPRMIVSAITAVMALALAGAACQAGEQANESQERSMVVEPITLTELVVDRELKAGEPYDVTLRYEATTTPKIISVCFLWSGEGPYCWEDFRVDEQSSEIHTRAFTGNPNTYRLTGFVRYKIGEQSHKSNSVSATIHVRRTSASASECKNYEYTAPADVTILDEKGILAAVEGNTVIAQKGAYKLYFKPDGTLLIRGASERRTFRGKWQVCDSILIMDTRSSGGQLRERLIADAGEGNLSFYALGGELVGTWPVEKGKSF